MGSRATRFGFVAVAAAALASCSPGLGLDAGLDGGGDASVENSTATCRDGRDNDRDGLTDCRDPQCASMPSCLPDADVEAGPCASVAVEAQSTSAPADVVWVIDSSGSMRGEAAIVQENLNAFSADITESGVDHRVVVITDPTYVVVPDPLGSDTTRYFFVNRPIRSGAALEELLAQLGVYRGFLRADAVTHFVIVSDDNSDMPADEFRASMEAQLGKPFVAHAIASEDATHNCDVFGTCDPGCTGPNGDAADIGRVYYELAADTGGQQLSICTSDWSALFATLREAVVVSVALPCAYALPEPPAGMAFDPDLVDVVFTDDDGVETSFARAMDPSRCADVAAWHYDSNDAPTRIELCPAACSRVSESTRGRVDVALGCGPDVILY